MGADPVGNRPASPPRAEDATASHSRMSPRRVQRTLGVSSGISPADSQELTEQSRIRASLAPSRMEKAPGGASGESGLTRTNMPRKRRAIASHV